MKAEELELLALKAGCKQPRVMARKKRDDSVCHVLLFTAPTGRKETEVALGATPEDAQAAIKAALVG
jgi:hypothetical protein